MIILDPRIEIVVDALEKIGGKVYYCGGFVHDILWNKVHPEDLRNNDDHDLEVYHLLPTQIESCISQFGKVVLVGQEFGVFRLYYEGLDIQLSLPCGQEQPLSQEELYAIVDKCSATGDYSDLYGLNAHTILQRQPDVNIEPRIACMRREHTAKSPLFDVKEKKIFDPWRALKSIKLGTFDIIPGTCNFELDPVRIIRMCAYHQRYHMQPSNHILNIADQLIPRIPTLTRERIYLEFMKFFKYPQPSKAIILLNQIGWLKWILPEVWSFQFVPQDPQFHPEGNLFVHSLKAVDYAQSFGCTPEECLGVLLHDIGKLVTTELKDGHIHSYSHDDREIVYPLVHRVVREFAQGNHELEKIIQTICCEHMLGVHIRNNKHVHYRRIVRRYYERQNVLSLQRLQYIVRSDQYVSTVHPEMITELPGVFQKILETEDQLLKDADNAPVKPILTGTEICEYLDIKPGRMVGYLRKVMVLAQEDKVFTDHESGKVYLQEYITQKKHIIGGIYEYYNSIR